MSDVPIIKPINITDYDFKQSKYEHVPKLPFRSIVVASSTGGKTVLIQNLILNVYRDCFARIFIFSPSVHNDPTFVEVKKYQKDNMKVDDEKEKLYYDTYQPEELEEIINTQRKIIHYMKEQKMKKLHSILIIVDDFADDPKFVRYSKLLHGLATRGRHDAISFCLSVQKYRVLAPIIRLNSSSLYIFKLKNVSELMSFIEENSAIVDKEQLLNMYHKAVDDKPYSFFYVNMNSKDVNNMFYVRFEKAFKINKYIIYIMVFYYLPIEIKNILISYILDDVRLLKIKNNNIIKKYINKFKPVYKSYKLNNMQYFEIDNININNGISYVFNLSELDKLHQNHKPLKLLIEYDILATSTSFTCLNHVRNRTLTSNNLFDIYYFLNKDLYETNLVYSRNMVNFISLQVKKITIKVIN